MAHRANQLLARLGRADYARLEPDLTVAELPLAMTLFEPEVEIRQIWLPHSGVVSQLNILLDGSAVECCTMGNETGFGLLAGLEPAVSFTRDIVQIPGRASVIAAAEFRAACAASPSLQEVVRRHLRTSMGFMAQSVACNARHRLEARLCRWLLTCADYVSGPQLPLTQEFIAAMLGVQRTTVTDAAGDLQDHGVIRVLRGKVTVMDFAALRQRSCECYEHVRKRIDETLGPAIRQVPPGVGGEAHAP